MSKNLLIMDDDNISYAKQSISQADIDAVVDVLNSKLLTQGPVLGAFENMFLIMLVRSMLMHLTVRLVHYIRLASHSELERMILFGHRLILLLHRLIVLCIVVRVSIL